MKKVIVIILVLLVAISNFSPISYLLKENYSYSNIDGSFKFHEEGGAGYNFAMAKKRYEWFLKDNPEKAKRDSTLYRTFTIKPWRFWQWGDYLFQNERFRLPYKRP
jgi:hypothetical protein